MSVQGPPAVLAVGAWLKNTACLLDASGTHWSCLHGDLRDAQACNALEASARRLRAQSKQPVVAIAHDLHPDFYSSRLALALADEWQVEAIGVQHHHAHIGAVMAEHALEEPAIGLALDGVGLGSDGAAWGGELLWVAPTSWKRLGHLWPLALPGGDVAAREPWRMLTSAMHAMGRSAELELRLTPALQAPAVRTLRSMLDKQLNCPKSTSAGRWFDAAAAALGLRLYQQEEAEAAMALEQQASAWFNAANPLNSDMVQCDDVDTTVAAQLDIRPLLARLLDWPATADAVPAAAAWFHLTLAHALADWAAHAARQTQCGAVCLGGGCFMNTILTQHVTRRLQSHGLRVYRPQANTCGDAGLALGQAWVVTQQCHQFIPSESLSCA